MKSTCDGFGEVSGSIFWTILATNLASRSVSGRLGKPLERLGEHLGGSWNGLSVLKRLGSVLERVRATSPFAGRAGGVHPPDKGESAQMF